MYYYQHHIGDFDRATRHLSRIERSIYLDMLFLYYESEAALPLDIASLCRKIVARTEEEKSAVLAVLDEFFHETPGGWFHDRCEEEIAQYRKTKSQASAAGQASAAARAERRRVAMGESPTGVERRVNENPTTVERPLNDRATEAQREVNGTSTNQEPRTNNHKPSKAPATPMPDWIPIPSWDAFVAMRKQIKKPVTQDAIPIAIAKLDKLRKAGSNPKDVLDQSTLNCWQGLFEVKPGQEITGAPKKQDWE